MFKKIITLGILLLFLLVLCIGAHITEPDPIETLSFNIHSNNITEKINIRYKDSDNTYYVFVPALPSDGYISVSFKNASVFTMDGESYRRADAVSYVQGHRYQSVLKNIFGKVVAELSLVFYQAEDVSSVFLYTESNTMDNIYADKTYKEPGKMTLIDIETNETENMSVKSIKGRGNLLWDMKEKRSFSINLDHEQSLLGMSACDKWALVTEGFDGSHMRNYITYSAANLTSMAFAPECKYVNLYINSEYNGLYILVQRPASSLYTEEDLENETQNSNSIPLKMFDTFVIDSDNKQYKGYNIENDPMDITGPYLLEIDRPVDYASENCGFISSENKNVIVKNPKYASMNQIMYVSDYFNEMESAVYSKDGYSDTGKYYTEYLDLDSAVYKYISEEISYNIDADISSTYFLKKSDNEGGQLLSLPLWDFDNAYGKLRLNFENAFHVSAGVTSFSDTRWYENLYNKPDFQKRVKEVYSEEYYPIIYNFYEYGIDETAMTLIPSIIMNDLRWTDKTCDNTDEIIPYYYLSIDYLKSFLGKRLAFLNDAWINGTEYVNIYIQIDGDSQYSRLSVPKGTTISQEILDRLYSYSYDGASVPRGLYYMEYTELEDGKMYFVGNEVPFDPSLPLWEDIDLYYLWDSP